MRDRTGFSAAQDWCETTNQLQHVSPFPQKRRGENRSDSEFLGLQPKSGGMPHEDYVCIGRGVGGLPVHFNEGVLGEARRETARSKPAQYCIIWEEQYWLKKKKRNFPPCILFLRGLKSDTDMKIMAFQEPRLTSPHTDILGTAHT